MDCAKGYVDLDGECMKEIKTVNILLTIPLANTIDIICICISKCSFFI